MLTNIILTAFISLSPAESVRPALFDSRLINAVNMARLISFDVYDQTRVYYYMSPDTFIENNPFAKQFVYNNQFDLLFLAGVAFNIGAAYFLGRDAGNIYLMLFNLAEGFIVLSNAWYYTHDTGKPFYKSFHFTVASITF